MNGWLTIKTRLVNGELKQGLKDITKSLSNAKEEVFAMVKSFSKMALIIGAVVGTIKLIQGGMKALFARNEELSAKIENIKNAASNLVQGIFNAMANLLEPIITRLVDWVYKFIAYLNVITKQFFNLDLFAKNTSKSLKSGAKSAKEIKKSLAGFDEMNVLSDTSSKGGAGGGTSVSEDIKDIEFPEVEMPSWIQWIIDNKDMLIGIIKTIGENILSVILGPITKVGIIIAQNWEGIKKVLGEVWNWINTNIIKPIVAGFNWLWDTLKSIFTPVIEFFTNIFTTVWENIKIAFDNIVKIFSFVWGKIKEIFTPVVEFFKEKFNKAKDKIKSIFEPIVKFFSGIWDKIKEKLSKFGSKAGETVGSSFKAVVNGVLSAIEKILNAPIKTINKLIDTINSVPGINLGKLSTFNLPRLAKGGIVSNPGMGVNMGSYIAGEKGAEAVLPLTDDTLQRLASMIPITIDLTNTIDGRVLNRRLETIRMNDSFAGNR